MTEQEHLQEVLFRISKTSNRLSIYLNEAPVLMTDLKKIGSHEKNSATEKKFNTRKNSGSELAQRVRMDWMDEILPIMLDEDEFNLTSLLTAISASIEAMNQLLDITKEKNSVDRTEKKFTFRERLMWEHPECVDPTVAGGCYGCPFSWGYEERPPAICNEETLANCEDCWDRECPKPLSCRDRLKKEHPKFVNSDFLGGCFGCPHEYGYIDKDKRKCDGTHPYQETCTACWDQPAKSV